MSGHYDTLNRTEPAPLAAWLPERELWMAVVKQAVLECAYPRKVNNSNERRRTELNRQLAHTWIFFSEDFSAVCRLAGVEADFVRTLARHITSNPQTVVHRGRRRRAQ